MTETTKPYAKKAIKPPERVRDMFDIIAQRYDLLNHLMSFGQDKKWRTLAAQNTGAAAGSKVLDACTGTGDLAFALRSITGAEITGVDFSQDMLEKAKEKAEKAGIESGITFIAASVDQLPFDDNSFDAITIGWGLRNTPGYKAVLAEFCRVTKPGGTLVCLESNQPEDALLRAGYRAYLSIVVPLIGRLASNNYEAYKYLSDSIQVFPPQKELVKMMKEAGWAEVNYRNFMFGAVAMHVATKS
ncbi:MAG TPA: bifunctional demethylmenaquinone methyltransferase/2-methoxy-6-polyprenyl-1,4-benzoquinol methylase UbiE [Candidatus Aquicultor sp.]|jgi:demethylmenaquinone methyltransferase/2-methoxy-6-polyprenyl-1,4-benzoquinol methylase